MTYAIQETIRQAVVEALLKIEGLGEVVELPTGALVKKGASRTEVVVRQLDDGPTK